MKRKLAAQLYTLRTELEKDFIGTLHKVKEMGWAGVQVSGYYGLNPQTIAEAIRQLGLGVAGLHIPFQRLNGELERVMEEARLFGTKDVICPAAPQEYRSEEGYRRLKRELNEIAARLEEEGLRLSYHNHAFEFEVQVEGQPALSYLLEPAPDNRILAEIDVYWALKGGYDPLDYIRTYSNRMPIIHLKDMSKDESRTFAEIGTGIIEFEPILQWGEQNGVEWYAVEQDQCPGHPLDSIRLSYANLTRMIDQLSE